MGKKVNSKQTKIKHRFGGVRDSHNGKTYAVIEYYPPEYNFRWKRLNRWLNKRALSGAYLQELVYVSLGSEK